VAFEIIGMLGKVFRIRGSNFRMLPNPTSDSWLKKIGAKASWKITKLMEIFQIKLQDLIEEEEINSLEKGNKILHIAMQCQLISDWNCTDEANLSIGARETIHDAIDDVTEYLLTLSQLQVLSVLVAHITKVVDVLDDPNSPLNTIVLANKEDALLSYYFTVIRRFVIGDRDPKENGQELNFKGEILSASEKGQRRSEREQRNTIWIALTFRMLCWLLLHDFDKSDVKIVPSDLKGSRMPVYIG
jgi:hypothetical protein